MTQPKMTPEQLANLLTAANTERAAKGWPPLTAEVWEPLAPTQPTPPSKPTPLTERKAAQARIEANLDSAFSHEASAEDIAAIRTQQEAEDDAEAERANLQAKADRLRELTTPALPTGDVMHLEVEHIDAWVPEEPMTPPAGSIPSTEYGTTADGRVNLTVLEHHCLNDALQATLREEGELTERTLRSTLLLAISAGQYTDAAALAILLARCAK